MNAGHMLSGRVSGPDGMPIADALAILSGSHSFFSWNGDITPRSVRTNEDGEFQFHHLAGPPRLLTVLAKNCAIGMEKVTVDRSSQVNMSLPGGRTITVRFVDGNGNPIPHVNVGIFYWNKKRFLELHHANSIEADIPRRADADGKYEWIAAAGDRLLCNFSKDGYQTVENYALTPTEGVYTVTLMPEPETGN